MAYWLAKVLLTPVLRSLWRVRVDGAGHIPERGPVILAANHSSFCDSLFLPLVVPRRVTYLAKADYFERRRTAWFFRAVGMIPIQRTGGTASERALAAARGVLRGGGVLALYPEGTRSPDGRLYKGHTGVARLALQCDVPVVPVWLSGTAEIQPIGARWMRLLKPVAVRVGAPLRWSGRARWVTDPVVLRQITDELMQAIGALGGHVPLDVYAERDRAAAPQGPLPASPR